MANPSETDTPASVDGGRDPGLFGPGSVTWRVHADPSMALSGLRPLLLQPLHQLAMSGVQQHSDFRQDPWGRLFRTLDIMTKIVFGDPATSDRAARRLRGRHRTVQGVSEDGVPYDARDPELLLWVWATLVDSSMLVYQRLLRPLSDDEWRRYYVEQKRFAHACGVPEGLPPETLEDFRAYFDRVVEHDLRATGAGRAVWAAIERPAKVPRLLQPVFLPNTLLTAGLLPACLRAQFGFEWGPAKERLMQASLTSVAKAIPLLPATARFFPEARRAYRRWQAAGLLEAA